MNKYISNAIMGILLCLAMVACGSASKQQSAETETTAEIKTPVFSADSAYAFCEKQCSFGHRTMNSEAHDRCGEWIASKFRAYGLSVVEQKADLKGYDGSVFHATNIIGSLNPEASTRIIIAAHWDTRSWADNDPDEANHRKSIEGANDGASGVGVIVELARLLSADTAFAKGIDFICFDAEDSGMPQWETMPDPGNTWCLGSQYWATHPHKPGYRATYGILLDMVGGRGAKFYQEGFSLHYAQGIVNKVWNAAAKAGYEKYFPKAEGGYITDDHVPVNQLAGIPMIDIVPHYPDCPTSNFGPTWHTVNDNMQNIDPQTLKAVGQTVLEAICD